MPDLERNKHLGRGTCSYVCVLRQPKQLISKEIYYAEYEYKYVPLPLQLLLFSAIHH